MEFLLVMQSPRCPLLAPRSSVTAPTGLTSTSVNLMKYITFRFVSVLALMASLALPAVLGADGDRPTPPPGGGPGGGGRRPDRGEGARPQRDAWLKEIGASEDQAAKIRDILRDQMDQQRALRQNADLTPEQRRAKMSEIRSATTAKIKGILTPDQFAKYEKLQEERRGRGPGGPGGPGGGKQRPGGGRGGETGPEGGKPGKRPANQAD